MLTNPFQEIKNNLLVKMQDLESIESAWYIAIYIGSYIYLYSYLHRYIAQAIALSLYSYKRSWPVEINRAVVG